MVWLFTVQHKKVMFFRKVYYPNTSDFKNDTDQEKKRALQC